MKFLTKSCHRILPRVLQWDLQNPMACTCFTYTANTVIPLTVERMGSFTSRPQMKKKDFNDETTFLPISEDKLLLEWVRQQLQESPPMLKRAYRSAEGIAGIVDNENSFRLLQWNILAQALGIHADNFVNCPAEALEWDRRRFRLLEEILSFSPDIICLQEVDHFKFFERALAAEGYSGFFMPKPDSPCIYLPENNGPDGCALFFRSERFKLMEIKTRVIEVWKVQSNQVAILASLRDLVTSQEVVILTTHLKARKGPFLASMRDQQGGDLLTFLKEHRDDRPTVVCGDFNAEPSEPIYERMTSSSDTPLHSAYARLNGGIEPEYSTWKIRAEGEMKHNIDYVFFTDDQLKVEGGVDAPTEEVIGPMRVPSLSYPSDHFSLICDFSFRKNEPKQEVKTKGRQ